ncbi:ISAs1 family transposase [Streptomyces erythrochromogenes]|uniref:ISAs1 family transposase n=1 Tax=Streptomyces erythrochromogenes TaxID=285574 RepID=UPI003692B4AA
MDGRSARGSRTDTAPAAHLLSAVTAAGRTVSRPRVPDRTSEITGFTALLAPFAPDRHRGGRRRPPHPARTREMAGRGGERPPPDDRQGNQPNLHAATKVLPRKEATARRHDREAGHGRRETRSIRTLTGLDLDFPHVVQAAKTLRHRTNPKTGRVTRQTGHAITDMTSAEASPQLIGRIARAQWGIETVHHVRDTTFPEDASTIRTGHGPENMATLRNFAINTLRDAGHPSITAGLRETSYTPFTRPLVLLGLPLTCDAT